MKSGMKKAFSFLIFLFAWLMLLPSCLAEWPVPPPPTQDIYLVDDANMVEPEDREKILAMGRDLDRATKAQVVVVTMTSLGSDSIENYANRLFRKWGIGDRTKNNGVLLLIAKEDRKFRIEVGYGLEGALTDSLTGQIQDQYMIPYFRKGIYEEGIARGYEALALRIAKEYNVQLAASGYNNHSSGTVKAGADGQSTAALFEKALKEQNGTENATGNTTNGTEENRNDGAQCWRGF